MTASDTEPLLSSSHLLGIEGLSAPEVTALLDLAETYVVQGRASDKKTALLKGRTLIKDAIWLIAREAKIVQLFRRLATADREALSRILGEMHEQLDRDFVGVPHSDD